MILCRARASGCKASACDPNWTGTAEQEAQSQDSNHVPRDTHKLSETSSGVTHQSDPKRDAMREPWSEVSGVNRAEPLGILEAKILS